MKIYILGTDDFPNGMAEVEKQKLIAKALIYQNCSVKFICKKSFNPESKIKFKGKIDGIEYFYSNLSARTPKNFILKHFLWIIGSIVEKLYLLFSRYDFTIVNSRSFMEILAYVLIGKLKNRKTFLTSVEDPSSLITSPSRLKTINLFLLNKYVWRLVDGAFPISEELQSQIRKSNPTLPQLKIPVLVDFVEFNNIQYKNTLQEPYFMFCGSSDYIDTVKFILQSFNNSLCKSKLLLVLNGSAKSMNNIYDFIDRSKRKSDIIVKSKLIKSELYGFYQNAKGLLIPLNFSQRDKARFPHKLGEYCASKNVIISTKWGEVDYYFVNKVNAILLIENTFEELSKTFEFVENNPKLMKEISQQSFKTAEDNFDYKLYGNKIISFYRKTLLK